MFKKFERFEFEDDFVGWGVLDCSIEVGFSRYCLIFIYRLFVDKVLK